MLCTARIIHHGSDLTIEGHGNGPINAFVHALEETGLKNFALTDYRSHAIRGGPDADSAAYVQLKRTDDGAGTAQPSLLWGCGMDPSIEMAGLKALVSAYNLLNPSSVAASPRPASSTASGS